MYVLMLLQSTLCTQLPYAGEIETCLWRFLSCTTWAWPGNTCWTPGEKVWAKLFLSRKGMSALKLVLELEAFTSMPVAVCKDKTCNPLHCFSLITKLLSRDLPWGNPFH